jgi:histone-lysine N-methyltransferase SUV39H
MHRIGSHGFPIITWKDIREAARKSNPKYYLAKDLPHDLQDYMNALDPSYREMSMSRTIFEANIIENTMDDEPDAPPIRIINEIDDEPTPLWEFHYSNQMWHGEGVPPPNILNLISCDCEGGSCDPRSKTCACLQRQRKYTSECTPDFAYDHRGRLKHDEIPIFECNDLCGCDEKCRNRVSIHSPTG